MLQEIPLFQDVVASMEENFPQIFSPLIPRKPQYNQISTLWTLEWWESETKNDNKIKILGSCEWFLEFCKGFSGFSTYLPQFLTTVPKEPHL